MTAKDVLKLAKEKGAKIVDLRFIDLPGLWQHFSIPMSELNEDIFEEGLGFDGSSIRGFQTIDESDMLLVPDASSAAMDPFTAVPTLVLICNVKDPVTGKWYTRDPRYIAQKAEAHLKKTGLADTVYIGPELEFFFFDSIRFDTLTKMADKVMWYKYCAKNTARKWGKTATFMPKPLFQDNGSGMHTHQSLWKNGKNLFFERGSYADISKTCLYYIGGILKHAPALLALIAPSTNSYKRLVPGYEAPINLVYSQRNRSACIRIPMYSKSEGAKRIEFRTPDPTCNPYLSFAACLMAGLDGVANKIDPGKPVDKDLYELPPAEAKKIKQLPGDLSIVLDNLEPSHDWLLKGDVFTPDVIETWLDYKRKKEVDPVRLRPHPWECAL